MDFFDLLIFVACVLIGFICAAPIFFALGQRSILRMVAPAEDADILDAAVVEEKQWF